MQERYVYDPYGSVTVYDRSWTTPLVGTSLSASTVGNTIGFASMVLDPVTGLYYDDARWYSTAVSTFISRDPAQADLNTYRYCANSPTDEIDPGGLAEITKIYDPQLINKGKIADLDANYDGKPHELMMAAWFTHIQSAPAVRAAKVRLTGIKIPANISELKADKIISSDDVYGIAYYPFFVEFPVCESHPKLLTVTITEDVTESEFTFNDRALAWSWGPSETKSGPAPGFKKPVVLPVFDGKAKAIDSTVIMATPKKPTIPGETGVIIIADVPNIDSVFKTTTYGATPYTQGKTLLQTIMKEKIKQVISITNPETHEVKNFEHTFEIGLESKDQLIWSDDGKQSP